MTCLQKLSPTEFAVLRQRCTCVVVLYSAKRAASNRGPGGSQTEAPKQLRSMGLYSGSYNGYIGVI